MSNMLLEKSGEITPEQMKKQSQSESMPSCGCDMMEVKCNATKNNIAQEHSNVRSLNQAKLEEVKQEMARMNIDILGIS